MILLGGGGAGCEAAAARRLGVSALFSRAGRATWGWGEEGGGCLGCQSTGFGVCAPWVVSPACGMGNEAFLRSNSITSFNSQEPAALPHESGVLARRVAQP